MLKIVKLNKKILLFVFQWAAISLSAQTLSGVVVDADQRKPISGVKVGIENTGIWTVTDQSGNFTIRYHANETVLFSRAGLLEERKTYATPPVSGISVEMQMASIRIKEVELSARKKNFSEIEIKEEALQKIQSFSLGDVLQQLPGQFIKPMAHTEMKNIVLRTATGETPFYSAPDAEDFGNKAFGTQLVINDIAVSNNGNMQQYNTASSSPFTNGLYGFNVTTNNDKGVITPALPNYGADLRQIPTENIEKIEVIAGIPDAKYGDLTSGLIKVETKSGKRPLQILTSLVEGTYQAGASQGFQLNEKGDALNVSLNYMNTNSSPRTGDVFYKRYAGNLLWTKHAANGNFRNRLGLDYMQDLNEGQSGEDMYHGIYVRTTNKQFSLRNNMNLKFGDAFLDGFNANLGVTYGDQNSMRRMFYNTQAKPYPVSMTEGVYYADYTPPQYFEYNYVDGNPLNIFLDSDVYKTIKTSKDWIHNVSLGINYRYSDNFGAGRSSNLNGTFSTVPSTIGNANTGNRNYDFDQVNSMQQFAAYLQNNIFKRFANSTSLTVNTGLRYDLQNKYSVLSPRVNASYRMKNLILRGGAGLATKAPSLNMIYTGPRYIDMLLGDYRLPGVYSVAIAQTIIAPANNADLKPSKSWRTEAGFDYKFPFATIALTGYRNLLFDGFTTYSNIIELQRSKVEIIENGTAQPTFDIVGTENFYYIQSLQTNGLDSEDTGLEMIVNFKKIESLNLNIGLRATYVETVNNKTVNSYVRATENPDIAYGVFSPYTSTTQASRAGINLDYHIPDAGLIISVSSDHFLLDSRITRGNQYPEYYLDNNLVSHAVTAADLENNIIKEMRRSRGTDFYDLDGKTFHNFHLRVSKDFLSGVRISVYLNNMFNLKAFDQYGRRYAGFTPMTFGGNLSYQF